MTTACPRCPQRLTETCLLSIRELTFLLHHQPAAVPKQTTFPRHDAWVEDKACPPSLQEAAWLSDHSVIFMCPSGCILRAALLIRGSSVLMLPHLPPPVAGSETIWQHHHTPDWKAWNKLALMRKTISVCTFQNKWFVPPGCLGITRHYFTKY